MNGERLHSGKIRDMLKNFTLRGYKDSAKFLGIRKTSDLTRPRFAESLNNHVSFMERMGVIPVMGIHPILREWRAQHDGKVS